VGGSRVSLTHSYLRYNFAMVDTQQSLVVGPRTRNRSRPQFTGTCPICGTAFVAHRSTRRFCSDTCRATYSRRRYLAAKFRLDQGTYDRLLAAQGGRCAICSHVQPSGYLAVDHDIASGRIRGLLCPSCKNGLGGFLDSPQRLTAALAYLRSPLPSSESVSAGHLTSAQARANRVMPKAS
jgi:hypothetical protein